jgi:Family of unknown function (DUF6011)
MTIRCGRCAGRHDSVTDVRACYNGHTPTRTTETHTSAERATAKQVDLILKLAGRTGTLVVNREDTEGLTKRQASAEIDRLLALAKGNPQTYPAVPVGHYEASNLPDVPAGHYAVKSLTGNNDLDFFRVDRPTEGRWSGRTFVKRVIGGKPDAPVRGQTALHALQAIRDAGPEAAGVLYGREIGQCYRCNRHLTNETSRALGIGPDCRSK